MLDAMVAAAIVGTSLVVVVVAAGRAMAVSQAVAQQVEAHEAVGCVLSGALLQTALVQHEVILQGSDAVGTDGLKQRGRSGDLVLDLGDGSGRRGMPPGDGSEYHPAVYIEEGDGVEWLRVAVVWEGAGGRDERVERMAPVRVVDGRI